MEILCRVDKGVSRSHKLPTKIPIDEPGKALEVPKAVQTIDLLLLPTRNIS